LGYESRVNDGMVRPQIAKDDVQILGAAENVLNVLRGDKGWSSIGVGLG